MLSDLYIKNYVLIDEISINFPSGLIAITGETGAGKSIILGALKLVLGERADYKVFSNDSEKCIIEATFILNETFRPFFNENELDFEQETLFRREISAQGKSRAFINDSPVTLDILQQLSTTLLDIHSQFDTASLLHSKFQMTILDNFAQNTTKVIAYKNQFFLYKDLQNQLKKLKNELSDHIKEKEYNTFLLEELNQFSFNDIHINQLENELKEQEFAEDFLQIYNEIYLILNNDELGIEKNITESISKLSKYKEVSTHVENLAIRLQSVRIEVQDISKEIENSIQTLEINPEKLRENKQKIDRIHSLFVKHQVNSVEDLVTIKTQLEDKTHNLSALENKVQDLENQILQIEEKLQIYSDELHQRRLEYIPKLSEKTVSLLANLGLEKTQLALNISKENSFNENGKDSIQFLFSANSGMALQPIEKAISGGERSRVMLVLKKIMAENTALPTLIFDEIDTGVSGRIADEMGKLMQEMAKTMQLIVITHLPQIAAKGSSHFKVIKNEVNGDTQTKLIPLKSEERVIEIAQLLSGASLTEAAIEQAKMLLT